MDVIIRAVIAYLLILLLLRITTRRIMRSATAADMVLVFVFGGFAIQGVMGDHHSMTAALLGLITISLAHLCVHSLSVSSPGFARLSMGSPVVVFSGGQWQRQRLRDLRVDEADVLSEMRQQGLRDMDEVDTVVVEHNGGISMMPKKSAS